MSSAVTADSYLRKAARALKEARVLLQEESTEGVCNRAYYAMHDAAHAALLAHGYETPETLIKTHHTLIAAFSKELVLSGKIDPTLGRAFNRVQDIRLIADYSAEPPQLAEATWAFEQAELFIASVRSLIASSKTGGKK